MNRMRVVQSPSGLRRLLMTFATALLLIAGLLAMHTLTGTLTFGHEAAGVPASEGVGASYAPGSDMGSITHPAGALDGAAVMGTGAAADHCSGDCGASGGVPDHSMLMMVCVLALLAAAIVLLAPVLLARLGAALALLRLHGRTVLSALPHPRPPSLLVLSISRT